MLSNPSVEVMSPSGPESWSLIAEAAKQHEVGATLRRLEVGSERAVGSKQPAHGHVRANQHVWCAEEEPADGRKPVVPGGATAGWSRR